MLTKAGQVTVLVSHFSVMLNAPLMYSCKHITIIYLFFWGDLQCSLLFYFWKQEDLEP